MVFGNIRPLTQVSLKSPLMKSRRDFGEVHPASAPAHPSTSKPLVADRLEVKGNYPTSRRAGLLVRRKSPSYDVFGYKTSFSIRRQFLEIRCDLAEELFLLCFR